MPPSRASLWFLCVTAVLAAPRARAEGTPPLLTNDPGTPGRAHWEINLAQQTEHAGGTRTRLRPWLEINYGLSEATQLGYAVADLAVREPGAAAEERATGNSIVALKVRFWESSREGAAMALSVFPQVEFATPHSSATRRGLADAGVALTLPLAWQRSSGPFIWLAEAGGSWRRRRTEGWFASGALLRQCGERLCVGMDLRAETDAGFSSTRLCWNASAALDVTKRGSLLAGYGRDFSAPAGSAHVATTFVGWQWRL
jgi:hypothetical protein